MATTDMTNTPPVGSDAEKALKDVIRECGGIVHSDGNIFFTNSEMFLQAAAALPALPEPVALAFPHTVDFSETKCPHCETQFYIEREAAPDHHLASAGKPIDRLAVGDGREPLSYHDVFVSFDGQRHRLFDASYGLQLQCTRAAGWELWNRWGGVDELLAGEYHSVPLTIEVGEFKILEAAHGINPLSGDMEAKK